MSAWLLVVGIAIGSLISVGVAVRLNTWNRDFFNAMQAYDWPSFVSQLWVFVWIIVGQIFIGMGLIYVTQVLEIRWRRWMTRNYTDRWLARSAHYRLQIGKNAPDNPDQRISMDIPLFIQRTLQMTLGDRALGPTATGLLTAIATLVSFSWILWNLSTVIPIVWNGQKIFIPGYLLWAALIYSVLSTVISHIFGRELIGLRFDQQKYEADFRYDLVRVRENSEQIALLGGEPVENRRLMHRFGFVADNWHRLMMRQVKLSAATGVLGGLSLALPSLLVAPAYFSKAVGFGELMQISSAFVSVQVALSFFVTNYPLVAEWKSMADRLTGFEEAVDERHKLDSAPSMVRRAGGTELRVGATRIGLPSGEGLLESEPFTLAPGESILLTGPNGTGKSTTFRALSGIWPHAEGEVEVPAGATIGVLPQKPYLPHGPLADALAYPDSVERWTDDEYRGALARAGLGKFADRLHESNRWDATMSGGEQQRVAIARCLLHRPAYLFLDEATASVDEASERDLYALLRQAMPDTGIISIGHRSTLKQFHGRFFHVEVADGRARIVEARVATTPVAAPAET